MPPFDIRAITIADVRNLCAEHHGYRSAGGSATYAFGVFEDDRLVAAYAWQPPPYGVARAVCPEAPYAVLSLSRMVAVPKSERRLKHISKPLRHQMRGLIDRTRWPVLVTFSDEGQGHNGYVYACSGWTPTTRTRAPVYEDADGRRASRYSNGRSRAAELRRVGVTYIQRWEHRVCPPLCAAIYLTQNGWERVQSNRVWRSGNAGFTIARRR